jgi:hypothetical protein
MGLEWDNAMFVITVVVIAEFEVLMLEATY